MKSSSMRKSCFRAYSRMARRWLRTSCCAMPALKARLSDAFDRFLEGVPDNRQVVFDDDGWRLKTDPAEHPDPAQSDSLVERAHSRFPGHALTPTGVMAIRCKQFHLPDL